MMADPGAFLEMQLGELSRLERELENTAEDLARRRSVLRARQARRAHLQNAAAELLARDALAAAAELTTAPSFTFEQEANPGGSVMATAKFVVLDDACPPGLALCLLCIFNGSLAAVLDHAAAAHGFKGVSIE